MYQGDTLPGESPPPERRATADRGALVIGEWLQQLYRATRDAMFLVDASGRLLAANASTCALFGYGPDELSGIEAARLYASAEEQQRHRQRLATAEAGAAAPLLLRWCKKSGERFAGWIASTAVRDAGGAVVGVAAVVRAVATPPPLAQLLLDPKAVIRTDDWADIERENIRRAMLQAGGKIAGPGGAAEILGTRPSTLRSQMKRLGIDRDAARGARSEPNGDAQHPSSPRS